MRFWIKNIYCVVVGIVFSGCASLFFNPTLDLSLAPMQGIQVIPDVSSIGFEWKRVEDASIRGFVVYRKDSKNEKFKRIAVIDNRLSTHFYDKNLKPETIYTYQFAILGPNNTISQPSKPMKIRTSFIQPVEFVYANSNDPRMVKIIWSPHKNPSIEKYIIEKKINHKWKKIAEVKNRLAIEYIDENLLDGVTYEYRVAGVNFLGDRSRDSVVASATTKFPPPPLEDIVASKNQPKVIILKWKPSEIKDLAGYIIYASQKEDRGYKKVAQTLKPYYEFKTEENGMQWFFKIVAMDKDGIQGSLKQTPIRGQSLVPPEQPIIKGASLQNGQAVIGWEAPSDRVSSVLVMRKEGSFGEVLEFKVGPKTLQFVDKEMQSGVKYTYWVEFVDINQIHSVPSQKFQFKKN